MRSAALVIATATMAASASAGGLRPAGRAAWDRAAAAHLLRRAAFGGTPRQVEAIYRMGREAAVDHLVDFEKIAQDDSPLVPAVRFSRRELRGMLESRDEDEQRRLRGLGLRVERADLEQMRAWWLRRMVVTARPFEEKMTLFWHGHFTSGAREVGVAALMWEQNAFFRRHALSDFRTLLVGISRDGAMLRYLDNVSNRKAHPNENYARELLELFSMGEGSYTEADVTEAARAFTGWTLGPEGFRFARRQHDAGPKRFLGRTGPFDGTDIIDIILEQDATARHLARRLLIFFVTDRPSGAMVRALAHELRRTRFDLRAALKRLFKSGMFYAPEARFSLVKSPVELVVGSMRLLESPVADPYALAHATRAMGQDLLQPPTVKGWDGGRKWINTATLHLRCNFAGAALRGEDEKAFGRQERRLEHVKEAIAELEGVLGDEPGWKRPRFTVRPRRQPGPPLRLLLSAADVRTAAELVDHCVDWMLQRPVTATQRTVLRRVLGGGFRAEAPDATDRMRELLHAIMSMPEYQLN